MDPFPIDREFLKTYGYSYAISEIPHYLPNPTYTRHVKGDNFSWAEGHVSYMSWQQVSDNPNGRKDYWWRLTK